MGEIAAAAVAVAGSGTSLLSQTVGAPLGSVLAVLWLVAVPVVAVLDTEIPAPRWLMIHLLLLGAVTHSILVWSRHFAETLLHLPPADRSQQSRRLLLHNLGAVTVIAGVLSGTWPVTVVGAASVASAVLWHRGDLARRLRAALPARFAVVVRYYVAAACFLPLTRQTDLPIELGTRHRAALGISDETDAVAIVVSEETGRISAAHNGEITLDLDSRELRNYLYKQLVREPRGGGGGGRHRGVRCRVRARSPRAGFRRCLRRSR